MNKSAIKKYAVWARNELIDRVSKKALRYGISADSKADPEAESVDGKILTKTERKQRAALIARIAAHSYEQTMEEVAYTWFNRFAALRFMEVNGYLPSHVRVFTNDAREFKPQILAEAIHLDLPGLDMDTVYALKEADKTEELFRYLIIVQCNALNEILPGMFQRIEDFTELLLPDNLLREGSVIERLIAEIPEGDWRDQVQIIGWLYQYYNTEPKDKVFADLKKNIKVSKEKIPAATQLFTPDWIVRYMVENSLGRLWLEGHPNDTLKAEWKYYLDEAEAGAKAARPAPAPALARPCASQEPEVQKQLAEIRKEYANIKPEDIRCIDPCMGSGHILCYLFDVLMQIYQDYGHTPREAVASILQNNLYGLDIDDRAAQLAYFAVMMKARQYDRRFFSRNLQPKVMAIQESNGIEHYEDATGDPPPKDARHPLGMLEQLLTLFEDAKEYGSLLNVPAKKYEKAVGWLDDVADLDYFTENIYLNEWMHELETKIPLLVKQAKMLSAKYDVVVTNPPYMGGSNMSAKLSAFVKKEYADYKSDLFSACMVKFLQMAKSDGYVGFLSPYVWMFISSYEKLRHLFIDKKTIETLIQFEYSAFEEATVPICTFVLQNRHIDKKGCYLRLVDYRGGMEVQRQKALEAIEAHDKKMYFEADAKNFAKIPGTPVAYWVSENCFLDFLQNAPLFQNCIITNGLKTGDNDVYIRIWSEVDFKKIGLKCNNITEAKKSKKKWFPHNKGGDFRNWYGNNELVVMYEDAGKKLHEEYKTNKTIRFSGEKYYFHKGITWTALSSSSNSYRYSECHIFDSNKGPMLFESKVSIYYILGLLNSSVNRYMVKILNPTLSLQIGDMNNIPFICNENIKEQVISNVKENISLSKSDWDSHETSWDFERHPLV